MSERDTKDILIREANAGDVPALANLHVQTFNETHAPVRQNGPGFDIRESQWRAAFGEARRMWFCFVAECASGELVGFAKGQPYQHLDHGEFAGELNKIYLLRAYHGRGLGKRLIGHVARRFMSQGISSMLLFGDASNPPNQIYEALGAERLLSSNGEFHGGYGWRDLQKLASICPAD